MNPTDEILRNTAEFFFNIESGRATMCIDGFNYSEEFIAGQKQGHQDAYHILQGLADHYEDLDHDG